MKGIVSGRCKGIEGKVERRMEGEKVADKEKEMGREKKIKDKDKKKRNGEIEGEEEIK